jgi:hypothetical protein
MRGPSGHGPSAHVLGTRPGVLTAIGDMYADPFADKWPGADPSHIGYVFSIDIPPGRTVSLMTFVVKGLSETYDPRGGFPIPILDAIVAPHASNSKRRIRDRARHRRRTAAGARPGSAWVDAAAAWTDRQLVRGEYSAGGHLHRRRENGGGTSAGTLEGGGNV